MEKAFDKSTHDKLKGSFITHIDGDPFFIKKDAEKKLEQLYKEYLSQNQGVVPGKEKNFLFSITFAPEKILLGPKLNKEMDNNYGCAWLQEHQILLNQNQYLVFI